MHPAAGWFMREKVDGKIAMSLGCSVENAQMKNGAVALQLCDSSGKSVTVNCDHVVTATGYRADMRRLPFLAPDLLARMAPPDGKLAVSDNFETPVEGLFAVGVSAMDSFGPLMRFMVGAEFAAPRVVAHLGRKLGSAPEQRAA
jgi:thioredoxin reductase